jgi:glycosyltransferase involved in cell wall biosynthesis
MKITWVTRSFLDYRVPVFKELDRLCGGNLSVIFYRDVVPERVRNKLEQVLGRRAVALSGEIRFSGQKSSPVSTLQRKEIRIPYQPGLIKQLQSSAPEVMISDGFFQWTYAPLLLRARKKIPHVMCYEATAHTERNIQFYRTWYRRMVSRWIDAICCNGSLSKEYIISLGFEENKTFVGCMAADSDGLADEYQKISNQEIIDFKQQKKIAGIVFLYVGRLVELKGLEYLLKAWKTANIPGTLLLVGDGPEKQKLEKFCLDHKLANVVFAGAVNYDNIAVFYRCADVFIIPTLQDNWSLVVPEAMACGLPIACSKYNGCYPELVKPGNGWVFDPLSSDDTVKMLYEITVQKDNLQKMGAHSQKIVAGFSPRHAAECIFQACNHILHPLSVT